jgi:hypothetical protein
MSSSKKNCQNQKKLLTLLLRRSIFYQAVSGAPFPSLNCARSIVLYLPGGGGVYPFMLGISGEAAMGNQPIYFWQLVSSALGLFLILHAMFAREFLVFSGDERLLRLSKLFLGLALSLLPFFSRL